MPKSLEDFARTRVRHGGYGSISEYFRELVRIDQRYGTADREPQQKSFSADEFGPAAVSMGKPFVNKN